MSSTETPATLHTPGPVETDRGRMIVRLKATDTVETLETAPESAAGTTEGKDTK